MVVVRGGGGFPLRLRRPTSQISQIKSFWSRLCLLVPTPPSETCAAVPFSALRQKMKSEPRGLGYIYERERIREGLMDFFFKGGKKKKQE